MVKVRLSQSMVSRFKPLRARERLFDAELQGLALEVSSNGRKSFHLIHRDQHGKQRQRKLGDAAELTLKKAREAARAALNRAADCSAHPPHNPTVDIRECPSLREFVQHHYLPHARATKRSWATDESLLRCHLLPVFGHRRLCDIQPQDVESYYHADLARGAARGSANRRIILLRYLFNLALRWEIAGVQKNPARTVQLVDPQNKRERYLNTAEMERLQAAIESSDNPMLRPIVATLLLTGMRKREVLDARWSDIDLDRGTWLIPRTKSGKPRVVQLSEPMVRLLQSLQTESHGPYAFANPRTGKPFVSIFYAWDTARCRAGLPDLRIHDLRHTFASLLINSSYDLYDVMHALGHTQIRTTMRYAHLSRERRQAAVEAVAKSLGTSFLAIKSEAPSHEVSQPDG